jgi:hypothetical protein
LAKIPKLPVELRDFRNALWEIFDHLGLPEPTPLQYDMADFLQTPHPQKMLQGYRGIGKSLVATSHSVHEQRIRLDDVGYTDLHTIFASAGKDFADEISTFAKRLIAEIPFYQCLMPAGEGFTSNVRFDVGHKKVAKEPSFKSAGIFGQTTGSRVNRGYLDDVEIPKTAGTVGMRDKLKVAVTGVSDLLPPEGGQIVCLGTPHFEDTLYNWIRNNGEWKVMLIPARYPSLERAEKLGDTLAPTIRRRLEEDPSLAAHPKHPSTGAPTDPQRFDEEALQKREAKSTPAHFGRQYLLDTTLGDKEAHPLRLSDLIFTDLHPEVAPNRVIWGTDDPIEDIPLFGLDGDRMHRPIKVAGKTEMSEYSGSVLVIDPSGKGKDETAYAVSKMLNATVFVPDFGGFLDGFGDPTLRAIAEIAKFQSVNAIQVETNFGDGMFESLLKPHLRAVKYPCLVTSKRSHGNKERRIVDTLTPLFNQHRMVIDINAMRRDAAERGGMGPEAAMQYRLAYQLSRLTTMPGCLLHDDRVEVLSMAGAYWVEHLAKSADEAASEAQDDDLDDWIRRATGEPRQKPNWTSNFLPNYMR